jgi:hypothetical protein
MSRILVFFPYNPLPPRHGAHRRCLEMLRAMRDLGHEVWFASSNLTSNDHWKEEGRALIEAGLAQRVLVHDLSRASNTVWSLYRRATWVLRDLGGPEIDVSQPPLLGRWFAQLCAEASPDVFFMNYAHWDRIAPEGVHRDAATVLETHDIGSVNRQMQAAIAAALGGIGRPRTIVTAAVPDELLREDFFTTRHFPPDSTELDVCDRYDDVIAISEAEAELIRSRCTHARTHFVPMTQVPGAGGLRCEGPALFPLGPNLFNVQGLLYFVRRVLPLVLAKVPEFRLRVTGTFFPNVSVQMPPSVEFLGFVPDYGSVTATSGFVVCPVFGGTGQQVKISEAMACGLPVVALRDAAMRSPLQHGVSGLVADTAEEFAEYVVELWRDRDRCRVLGEQGRAFVAAHLGPGRLSTALESIFAAAGASRDRRKTEPAAPERHPGSG